MGGLAADLEAVLDDAGIYDAHIVGASMGRDDRPALRAGVLPDEVTDAVLYVPRGPDAAPVPEETQERMFDTPDGASERETIRHRMRPAFNERFTNRNPT